MPWLPPGIRKNLFAASRATGISPNPTLEWNPSLGAETYDLQISDAPDFSTVVLDESGIVLTSYLVGDLENGTTYYWRVSAVNDLGASGWSTVWSFRTIVELPDPVCLVSPPDGGVVGADSVAFSWCRSEQEVDRYWLEFSVDSLFTTSSIDSMLTDTATVARGLLHNQKYWWRVRAHNEAGWGPFSSVWSFLVLTSPPQAPLLVSPPDGAINQPVRLSFFWRTVSPLLMTHMTEQSREISSRHHAGAAKRRSHPQEPKAPSARELGLSAKRVSLDVVSMDSAWYHFQLASTVAFDKLLVNDSTLVDTTTEVSSLGDSTTYYWRVRAMNLIGSSLWSDVWTFITISRPARVVLSSPEDGAILSELSAICHWFTSRPRVDRYWFEWASDSTFSDPRIDSTGADTISVASPLLDNLTYYWKVRAHNDAGWGPFSEVWDFSVVISGMENQEEIPTAFSLSQNYPNPFNPSTIIRYSLPERSHVRLEVLNLLGQKISVLVDAEQEAGYHSAVLGSHGLASGLYFYRIQAIPSTGSMRPYVETKKLIVVR